MKIAVHQGHFPVGRIQQNLEKIIANATQAKTEQAEIIFFPELALTGYSPEDILYQAECKEQVTQAFEELKKRLPTGIAVGVGLPIYQGQKIYNALVIFENGQVIYQYHKQALPNHGIFDDKRHFSADTKPGMLTYKGLNLGFLICEDLWRDWPELRLKKHHPDVVIAINASPFEQGKRMVRIGVAQKAVNSLKVPVLYVHQVGLQDEAIYDGGSFFLNEKGEHWVLPQFKETLAFISVKRGVQSVDWQKEFDLEPLAETYEALRFALKQYIEFNNFPGVLLGLSGGVDSALVLALAVDALGADRVEAILMPSRYTAQMSIEDAVKQADTLGVKHKIVPIDGLYKQALKDLQPHFAHAKTDVTEENLQSRIRGLTLMALSNKSGKVVLATTNKSELAVGYGTMYGDLIGAMAPIKDIYKTEVYKLAHFRNSRGQVIPERVLTRAPSAELRENQTDQDSLPDYAILDEIIKCYVEKNQSATEIKAAMAVFSAEIERVISLIQRNEYKRKQAPFGPKITPRAFGKDWRIPLMS